MKCSTLPTQFLDPNSVGANPPDDELITMLSASPPLDDDHIFHVAVGGCDANTGRQGHPWLTISHAVKQLKVHDDGRSQAIYVHTGVYKEQRIMTMHDGLPEAPLWLIAEPGVTIEGKSGINDPFIVITKAYWLIEGFEIVANQQKGHAIRVQTDSQQGFQAHHVVIRKVDVRGVDANAAVVFAGARHSALVESVIYDNGVTDEDCHGVFVTNSTESKVDSQGKSVPAIEKRTPAEHILIKKNRSGRNRGDSIQCATSPNPPTDPVPDPPGLPLIPPPPRHIIIEDNFYESDDENAIDIKSCTHVTIRNNWLWEYFGGTPRDPSGAAIVVHFGAGNIVIDNNYFAQSTIGASLGTDYTGERLGPILFLKNFVTTSCKNAIRFSRVARSDPQALIEIRDNNLYNYGTAIIIGHQQGCPVSEKVVIANNRFQGNKLAVEVEPSLITEVASGRNTFVGDPYFKVGNLPIEDIKGWQARGCDKDAVIFKPQAHVPI